MSFSNIPIRQKLALVIMLTSSAVLLLTGAALIVYEFIAFKQTLLDHLRTVAQIAAEHSTAALGFQDEKAAANDGSRVENNNIIVVVPVIQVSKQRLGTLYVRSDLSPVYERISLYAGVVVLILLGSFAVTFALSAFFQRRISQPILALAEMAQTVSARKDYSVRAPKLTGDELGILTDAFNDMLTQIHERDLALREKEARLRLALEASHTGTWERNIPANELVWDEHAHRLFGLSPGAFPGTFEAFLGLVHPDDREIVSQAVNRALQEKTELAVEYRVVWPDASIHYIVSRGAAIYDASGKALRMTGVVLDATESKRAEEEIRRLNADLERRVEARTAELTATNKELEAFTYSVAHDLRAPLRHIDGYVQILQQEFAPQLSAEGKAYAQRIQEGTQNMARLVDDLLNLARVGRQELSRQVTGLQPIVTEVITHFRAETDQRSIEWRVGELPFVECDPGLIKQVFANLISNAIKYTRPRAHPVIEVGQMPVEGEQAIYVRDNGVGFSMRYADKLFGVFQRLHRAEDFEGTGVGLATVDRIIRKHGGRVWAEAELDKGATFFFVLDKKLATDN